MGAHFLTRSKLLALSIFESEKTHTSYCTHFNIVYDSKQKGVTVIVGGTHMARREVLFCPEKKQCRSQKKVALEKKKLHFCSWNKPIPNV